MHLCKVLEVVIGCFKLLPKVVPVKELVFAQHNPESRSAGDDFFSDKPLNKFNNLDRALVLARSIRYNLNGWQL